MVKLQIFICLAIYYKVFEWNLAMNVSEKEKNIRGKKWAKRSSAPTIQAPVDAVCANATLTMLKRFDIF